MLASIVAIAVLHAPVITKDIVYRKVEDNEIKADFYYPEKPLREPAPFVIVIHGGSWMQGKRSDMAPLCEGLAQSGLASATIDYRLSPRHKWPAHIQDSQAAVRYFRANAEKYKIDPNNFGATGASAGGHLALLLGLSTTSWEPKATDNPQVSESVKCVVNFFGPTDLTQDFNPALANIVCQQVLGVKYDKTNKDIINLGPLAHVTKSAPPIFTIQGDADTTVPPKQANRLDEALKAVGATHTLRMIPGMAHEFPMENQEFVKALSESVEFLKKNLSEK